MPLFEVLIPVKAADAKSRLGSSDRVELAAAFLQDTMDACADAELVSRIHVVADGGQGLNGDLKVAHDSLGRPRAAVILGDLPCLTGALIDEVLTIAAHHRRWFISDASGLGTTMLGIEQGQPLAAAFGERSRAAHRVSGAVELQVDDPRSSARLHRDVDTDVDLWDAWRLGVGPATQRALNTAGMRMH
jgi:2-phospho-L-lactate/phosphoenolpyruvate guanylyltransferase